MYRQQMPGMDFAEIQQDWLFAQEGNSGGLGGAVNSGTP